MSFNLWKKEKEIKERTRRESWRQIGENEGKKENVSQTGKEINLKLIAFCWWAPSEFWISKSFSSNFLKSALVVHHSNTPWIFPLMLHILADFKDASYTLYYCRFLFSESVCHIFVSNGYAEGTRKQSIQVTAVSQLLCYWYIDSFFFFKFLTLLQFPVEYN